MMWTFALWEDPGMNENLLWVLMTESKNDLTDGARAANAGISIFPVAVNRAVELFRLFVAFDKIKLLSPLVIRPLHKRMFFQSS